MEGLLSTGPIPSSLAHICEDIHLICVICVAYFLPNICIVLYFFLIFIIQTRNSLINELVAFPKIVYDSLGLINMNYKSFCDQTLSNFKFHFVVIKESLSRNINNHEKKF